MKKFIISLTEMERQKEAAMAMQLGKDDILYVIALKDASLTIEQISSLAPVLTNIRWVLAKEEHMIEQTKSFLAGFLCGTSKSSSEEIIVVSETEDSISFLADAEFNKAAGIHFQRGLSTTGSRQTRKRRQKVEKAVALKIENTNPTGGKEGQITTEEPGKTNTVEKILSEEKEMDIIKTEDNQTQNLPTHEYIFEEDETDDMTETDNHEGFLNELRKIDFPKDIPFDAEKYSEKIRAAVKNADDPQITLEIQLRVNVGMGLATKILPYISDHYDALKKAADT